MTTIQSTTFLLDESPDISFSRLPWHVESTEKINDSFGHVSESHIHKTWIGVLKSSTREFNLRLPRGPFFPGFAEVRIQGCIQEIGIQSQIEIQFKIRILLPLFIYLGVHAEFFFNAASSVGLTILWGISYPAVWFFITKKNLANAETKIENVFGVVNAELRNRYTKKSDQAGAK